MAEGMSSASVGRAPPVERMLRPFREFVHLEAAGGLLLLGATALALAWANSPWASSYASLWQTRLAIGIGAFALDKPLLLWINDGLMAVFFFVVGLEIKRELLVGELATRRQAALPIAAALGGMLIPAALYAALNAGTRGVSGWGVPMATDIAFALGVLALLGRRVPLAIRVFVTALAVVDDIGAVLVIALFYTPSVAWGALFVAAGFVACLVVAHQLDVRDPLVYGVLGAGLWVAILQSGVHATVAGVLLAMTIPARVRIAPREFVEHGRALLSDFERASAPGTPLEQSPLVNAEQAAAIHALQTASAHAETPLQRLEHALHPSVAFAIMPLFALANAGIPLTGAALAAAMTDTVAAGVVVGLVIGKQAGVTLFTWLVVRSGMAALPPGVTWRHVYGAGWLAGIGFTMSLFVANLAFDDAAPLASAKVAILLASLVAGAGGWLILRRAASPAAAGPAVPAA